MYLSPINGITPMIGSIVAEKYGSISKSLVTLKFSSMKNTSHFELATNSPFMKSREFIGLAKSISFLDAIFRLSSAFTGALFGSLSNFTPSFSPAGAKA